METRGGGAPKPKYTCSLVPNNPKISHAHFSKIHFLIECFAYFLCEVSWLFTFLEDSCFYMDYILFKTLLFLGKGLY